DVERERPHRDEPRQLPQQPTAFHRPSPSSIQIITPEMSALFQETPTRMVKGPPFERALRDPRSRCVAQCARMASSNSATMLVILIIGFTAGPAVSLYGSPTVSPVTAALWASEPLPPWCPSSMYFLALSQAPPPEVIEMATKMPVTITPSSMAPTAAKASALPAIAAITKYSTIGDSTGSSDGIIISLIAALVSMSTARP